MKLNDIAITAHSILNYADQNEVLEYIKKYPSKEGEIARKSYNKIMISAIIYVVFMIIVLIGFAMSIDISTSDISDKDVAKIVFVLAIPFIGGIMLVCAQNFIFGKAWNLYKLWYEEEIKPYKDQDDFEEIIANKKFYNVKDIIKGFESEQRKLYTKYKNKAILYDILMIVGIGLIIWGSIKFELSASSWLVIILICIDIFGFTYLRAVCEKKMKSIKFENKKDINESL